MQKYREKSSVLLLLVKYVTSSNLGSSSAKSFFSNNLISNPDFNSEMNSWMIFPTVHLCTKQEPPHNLAQTDGVIGNHC